VAGGSVVGAAISAAPEGRRLLLGLGVAPDHRRRGLGAELLRRHVGSTGGARRDGRGAVDSDAAGVAVEPWEAAVTVGERDPVEPLDRATRGAIARRLLEGAGFRVERAAGLAGAADPGALVARRG
jgi:ribosomal protein S18 acetylase RimI-like enzyme